jgi:predicted ATPase
VLATQFLETAETHPEHLAHHYTEAGHTEQAIGYWQRAGEQAAQRSAHVEAIAHLTKGLALLATQPDSPEHTQRELTYLMTLGPALIATKGQAAPEVEQTYARALALCQPVGQAEQLSQVLWGLRRVYHVRAEYRKAWEVGKRILELAQGTAQPHALLMAYTALGPP